MNEPPTLSRRSLIQLIARTGGVAGAFASMTALGLLPTPEAYAGPPRLPQNLGRGKKVVVVGAGIAGLVATYELHRAGYECVTLEANDRIGGRILTLRAGDPIAEKLTLKNAAWPAADHLYFDAGASRISHRHEATLDYCHRLGVEIRPFISDNRSAYVYDEQAIGATPVRISRVAADARGYIAELLGKALNPVDLDQPLSESDYERLREFLRLFGSLAPSGNYRGSPRAGFSRPPGTGDDVGEVEAPLPLQDLLRSRLWQETITFPELFDHASPMFEAAGGMDRLTSAFLPHIPPVILGARCAKLQRIGGDRVRVHYSRSGQNEVESVEADHAIICVPLHLLASVDNDFPREWREAIAAVQYTPAVRIGLYSRQRFWEREGLYGGISWTSQDISQIWYPSSNLLGRDGIFVGAYIWDDAIGERFSDLAPDDRIRLAVAQGQQLHPTLARHVGPGAAVAWRNMPFSQGAWCKWPGDTRRTLFPSLSAVHGPYQLAGEHVSNLPGWQEGAVRSAQEAVVAVAETMQEAH